MTSIALPRLAFVFPGQGSQFVGMLVELGQAFPLVGETFEEASEVLGYDLWRLCQEGPAERLDETVRTQPAMLTSGVAVWRVWRDQGGVLPGFMAGHSLGEYTALVCAGAMEFPAALEAVVERARLMQAAVPAGQGGMAAIIGLDDEAVRQLCADCAEGEVLEAVNFNAPGQVVIAGTATAVKRAVAASRAAGAKRAIPLPVSVPSHCRLMSDAATALARKLETIRIVPPDIPVVHNVDADRHDDPEAIREALVRQLHAPVLWVDSVRRMIADGTTCFIEAGPGKVLAGLGRRIERGVPTLPVHDPEGLEQAMDRAIG